MKQLIKIFTLVFIFLLTSNIFSQQDTKKLKLYGDVRFRIEMDRNSDKTDGTTRNDRDRLRYRLRFGFKYTLTDYIEFGGRIRSGNPMNQQSSHVTLGKEFHSDEFSIDKAYIKAKTAKGLWAWVGKNRIPFWEQNEFLWDGDINPEGIAFGGKFKLSEKTNLTPVFGYFIAGHSGKNFNDDNSLTIAQLKLNSNIGENNLIISSGLVSGSDIPNLPDGTHTYLMDYKIWATSFQFNFKKTGLVFGFDYMENLTDYVGNVDINDIYEDQTTGYVGSLLYNVNKFQFGYYYAHIEKFAVVDFLAQDDWVRWGNSNYTRSSNFSGHEFRIKYKITNQFNTVLRTYFVEGLKTTGSTLETGTRIRLDLNIKF